MLFRGQVAIQDNPTLAEASGWEVYEAESVQPVFCGNNSRFAGIAQIYAVCVSRICPNTKSRRTPTTLPESAENLAAY